jgi:hypothetical protein
MRVEVNGEWIWKEILKLQSMLFDGEVNEFLPNERRGGRN